jgi:spermidine synthase
VNRLSSTLLYILFTLGGVAGLIYEVVWTRSFSLVIGSTTRSAAVVLAAYFAGMALGNHIGGRLSRHSHPVRLYGLAEMAVGLTALPVLTWLSLFTRLYPTFYDSVRAQPGLLTGLKLVLAAVAIGPPVIAMGATLPLMTRALVSRTDHVAGRTGLLYALNTGGATVGVLLAGFFLPVAVGVRHSAHLAVCINVIIGLIAVWVGTRSAASSPTMEERAADGAEEMKTRPALSVIAVAAISGFGTLALEVVYTRMLSRRTEMSVYSFALMLATFLVFLALGSAVVSRWLDRVRPWPFLAWTQLAAAAAILASPVIFRYLPEIGFFAQGKSFAAHLGSLVLATVLALGPAVLLIGVVLPTSWKLAADRVSLVGRRVGLLTGVNTLAAVAGSLTAGFLLLPLLGVGGCVLAIASLYGGLMILACWQGARGAWRIAGVLACMGLLLGWYRTDLWRIEPEPYEADGTVVWHEDGETASVAVDQLPGGHRTMWVNHDRLGGSGASLLELRQGRLPLVLHHDPRRVAFIGVATGITASAVLDFPVERVVAIEVVPGVADAVACFDKWNRSVFDDPRVKLIVEDGRNYLLGTQERFDVIIGDLFVPWNPGTGYLYTVEHFHTVADRLAPGGLFCQWLPGYQLSVEELRTICASFLEAFPAATMWRGGFSNLPVIALVGHRDGLHLSPEAILAHCQRMARGGWLHDPLLAEPAALGLLYVCGPERLNRWAEGAPRNTDDCPTIEFSAPRSFSELRGRYGVLTLELLTTWRPRVWAYDQPLSPNVPMDLILSRADRMQDATAAKAKELLAHREAEASEDQD